MNPRVALYARLLDEIAVGWPDPWYRQDRVSAGLPVDLVRYIDELADIVCEGRCEANVAPQHRKVAA